MSSVLEGVRLSELARCPRMCSLRALGAEAVEPPAEWQRYFARGQLFTFYAYQQFAAKYGAGDIEREREIDWRIGIGHADIYIRSRKELIEVKSTTAPTGSVLEDAVRQVGLYLMHDLEAERAGVYLINPSNLAREDFFPVKLTDSLREELEERIAAVTRAIETRELPACVCSSPSACRHRGCPFTETAWEGWEAPPLEEIAADPETVARVAELYAVKQVRKQLAATDKPLEQAQKEIQAMLEATLPIGKLLVGGYAVAVSPRARESFSLKKARASLPADVLDPFTSRTQFTVYDMAKVEGAAVPEDWGEVPWSDEDLG